MAKGRVIGLREAGAGRKDILKRVKKRDLQVFVASWLQLLMRSIAAYVSVHGVPEKIHNITVYMY